MNIADLVDETPPKGDPGYPAWLQKLQAAAKVSVQSLVRRIGKCGKPTPRSPGARRAIGLARL